MRIKNEKELLELFVAEDYPARFARPFLNEYYADQVWATNSHILIIVMKDCLTGEYPKDKIQMPDLEELIRLNQYQKEDEITYNN